MPTVQERLATLEEQVEELRRIIEGNRTNLFWIIGQTIQILMIAALWFKK
jgi:hypothetical protein